MDITGRKLFVKALQEEGVDTIFAYPGGMVTDIVDELYKQDSIHVVLPRHEQALIHEAEGYARATGRVGVCLVTSGPGATNTITGIADAHYDSIPLVIFTGQVPQSLIGNDAFQEVDIVGMTRSIVKYGVTVRDRKDLGRIIKMAFQIASSGKPGPVLIDIPKDIQTQNGPAGYPDHVDIRGYKPNETVHIGQLKKAYKILKSAKQPLLLAGGGVNISGAQELLTTFAEKMHIPVVTTVMGKGAIPTDHPLYVGNSGMHGRYAANMAVSECDVLFSVGTRFNDRITGDLNEFAPKAKIVHLDIDASSISRNVVVDVPVVSDAKIALERLVEYGQVAGKDWHVAGRKSAGNATRPWTFATDDHGSHQRYFPTGNCRDGCRTAPDVGNAVYYHAERQADDHFRWSRNDGVWFPGSSGRQDRSTGQGCCLYYRRRRHADEHAGNGDRYLRKSATDHLYFE